MTLIRALQLAIKALKIQEHRLAFDANLEEKFKAGVPVTLAALKDRKKIREAIDVLEEHLATL